jgi:hypothetical protein
MDKKMPPMNQDDVARVLHEGRRALGQVAGRIR